MIKEIRGLKCSNHDYVKDNHHFMYQEAYLGCKAYFMYALHKVWIYNVTS